MRLPHHSCPRRSLLRHAGPSITMPAFPRRYAPDESAPRLTKPASPDLCIQSYRCLSQQALGERLGITAMSVSNYESGRNDPSARTMVAIAEALNVTVDDLTQQPPE